MAAAHRASTPVSLRPPVAQKTAATTATAAVTPPMVARLRIGAGVGRSTISFTPPTMPASGAGQPPASPGHRDFPAAVQPPRLLDEADAGPEILVLHDSAVDRNGQRELRAD